MKQGKPLLSFIVLAGIVLAGAIGLVVAPAWSQQAPGSPGGSGVAPPSGKTGSEKGVSGAGAESQKYSKETVREIQQALKKEGHDPGTIDGTMNQKTQQALREFQKKNKLKVTGTPNKETAEKLGVSLDESTTGSKGGAKGSTGAKPSERPAGKSGTSPK